MNIQYVSDLHLEMWRDSLPFTEFVQPLAVGVENKCLILAGDIAPLNHYRLLPFLKWCGKQFNKVFYISGNHEFYMKKKYTIQEATKLKQELCQKAGVIPLENQVFPLTDDTVIIGSVLWSDINNKAKEPISKYLNDYRQIKNFTVDYQNELHRDSVKFIEESCKLYKDKTKIVVTHHAPMDGEYTIPLKYRGEIFNAAFATDLCDLVKQVDYWIYGHTHFSTEFQIDNCKVMANCKGYMGEVSGIFDNEKHIKI